MRSDIALIVDLAADIAPDDLSHATFSFHFRPVRQTGETNAVPLVALFVVGNIPSIRHADGKSNCKYGSVFSKDASRRTRKAERDAGRR